MISFYICAQSTHVDALMCWLCKKKKTLFSWNAFWRLNLQLIRLLYTYSVSVWSLCGRTDWNLSLYHSALGQTQGLHPLTPAAPRQHPPTTTTPPPTHRQENKGAGATSFPHSLLCKAHTAPTTNIWAVVHVTGCQLVFHQPVQRRGVYFHKCCIESSIRLRTERTWIRSLDRED